MYHQWLAFRLSFMSWDDEKVNILINIILIWKSDCFHVCIFEFFSWPFAVVFLFIWSDWFNLRLVDGNSTIFSFFIHFFNLRIVILKLASDGEHWSSDTHSFSIFVDVFDSENMRQVVFEVPVKDFQSLRVFLVFFHQLEILCLWSKIQCFIIILDWNPLWLNFPAFQVHLVMFTNVVLYCSLVFFWVCWITFSINIKYRLLNSVKLALFIDLYKNITKCDGWIELDLPRLFKLSCQELPALRFFAETINSRVVWDIIT